MFEDGKHCNMTFVVKVNHSETLFQGKLKQNQEVSAHDRHFVQGKQLNMAKVSKSGPC